MHTLVLVQVVRVQPFAEESLPSEGTRVLLSANTCIVLTVPAIYAPCTLRACVHSVLRFGVVQSLVGTRQAYDFHVD